GSHGHPVVDVRGGDPVRPSPQGHRPGGAGGLAVTAIPLKAGDEAYLVPRTLACARGCWRQQKVPVVSTDERPILLVKLPDDREIRVHQDDTVRRRPKQPRERRATTRQRPVIAGVEEVPLW